VSPFGPCGPTNTLNGTRISLLRHASPAATKRALPLLRVTHIASNGSGCCSARMAPAPSAITAAKMAADRYRRTVEGCLM
jgi:hypothetical protein